MNRKIIILFITILTISGYGQNRVLSLTGNGDYVSLPQPVIDSETFSIEAWYLILGDGGGIDHQNIIFSQRTNETDCYNSSVSLYAKQRSDAPFSLFSFRTEQGCGESVQTQCTGEGQWHHLAGVKSDGELQLYVDGQLVSSVTSIEQGSVALNIATTEIGRHFHTFEVHGYFIGMLDEIRVWNYPLSEAEINSRMDGTLTGEENGLTACWNFDDGTADDITGNGNSGTLQGFATTIALEVVESPSLWGDLNEDGARNISDVIMLINFILGIDD